MVIIQSHKTTMATHLFEIVEEKITVLADIISHRQVCHNVKRELLTYTTI